MSELRVVPVALLAGEGGGSPLVGPTDASEDTRLLFDREVRRVIEDAHAHVSSLLRKHQEQLDALAAKLQEAESIAARDAYAAAGVPMRVVVAHGEPISPAGAGSPGLGRRESCELPVTTAVPAGAPRSVPAARRAREGLVAGYLRGLRTGR